MTNLATAVILNTMIDEKMLNLGTERSAIRELFEYGNELKKTVGNNKVFDFTIGNPSVLPPKEVKDLIKTLLDDEKIHGYTSAQGAEKVRIAMAKKLSERFNADFSPNRIIMTVGAAASLSIVFKALISSKDEEIIVLKPYFPEYKVFIEGTGGKCAEVGFNDDLSIDFDDFISKINKNTVAVVVNSPNNPTGLVYSEDTLKRLAEILEKKQREFAHPIFIVSDEPYREIVFDGAVVPFIPKIYKNTVITYSYSKSLSIPGERIGYIAIPSGVDLEEPLYLACLGAMRVNGYVCAPSIFQRLVAEMPEIYSDTTVYENNRNRLIENLGKWGYKCFKPHGAFYLFVKSPLKSSVDFSNEAKKLGLLVVPADSFGAKGYLRIATCVSPGTVEGSLPIFKSLAEKYIK